jgi:hypothetical protein
MKSAGNLFLSPGEVQIPPTNLHGITLLPEGLNRVNMIFLTERLIRINANYVTRSYLFMHHGTALVTASKG